MSVTAINSAVAMAAPRQSSDAGDASASTTQGYDIVHKGGIGEALKGFGAGLGYTTLAAGVAFLPALFSDFSNAVESFDGATTRRPMEGLPILPMAIFGIGAVLSVVNGVSKLHDSVEHVPPPLSPTITIKDVNGHDVEVPRDQYPYGNGDGYGGDSGGQSRSFGTSPGDG